MPDQNNPANPPTTPSAFDAFPSDIPPLPGDAPLQAGAAQSPAATSGGAGGAGPVSDIPQVIMPPTGKKGATGKIFAAILGILVLVGGLGAGIILVQQQQLFKQKAAEQACTFDTSETGPYPQADCSDGYYCKAEIGLPSYVGICTPLPAGTTTCNAGETCRSGGAPGTNGKYGCAGWDEISTGQSCSTVAQGTCCVKPAGGGGGATPTPPPTGGGGGAQPNCNWRCVSGSENTSKLQCIPNFEACGSTALACRDEGCDSGGGGDSGGGDGWVPPKCTIHPKVQISSDNGLNWKDISGTTITVPAGTTKIKIRGINAKTGKVDGKVTARVVWHNDAFKGAVCINSECDLALPGPGGFPTRIEAFENEIGGSDPNCTDYNCQSQSYYGKDCVNRGGVNLATGAPAQCLNIQAFDTSWVKITDLSTLKVGDKVRFTVAGQTSSGSFDRARFIINGTTRPEVTAKRPNTQEFYDEYTIPTGITTFSVNAQLHHTTLGWF